MLTGGRIDRTTSPWTWVGPAGSMGWSDASGLQEQPGWTWGCALKLEGRDDHLLASGHCPSWVVEATTAELWGMLEVARLIVRERGPHARAALVCDNTHAVFAAVSVLRGSVPPACRGDARDAALGVLRAVQSGEGDAVAAARAKACVELVSLGRPVVLRTGRETPEIQIADHLARQAGGFTKRRDTIVQADADLRRFMSAHGV